MFRLRARARAAFGLGRLSIIHTHRSFVVVINRYVGMWQLRLRERKSEEEEEEVWSIYLVGYDRPPKYKIYKPHKCYKELRSGLLNRPLKA